MQVPGIIDDFGKGPRFAPGGFLGTIGTPLGYASGTQSLKSYWRHVPRVPSGGYVHAAKSRTMLLPCVTLALGLGLDLALAMPYSAMS